MPEQDLYGDAAPAAEAPNPSQGGDTKTQDNSSDSQTAELPKAVLGGKEFAVGDEVVLKITQVMEDSVLVKYATTEEPDKEGGEKEGGGKEQMAEAPMPGGGGGGGGGMSALME